jgi:ATP-dependent DNA helicase RecG
MLTLDTELSRIRGLAPNFLAKLQKLGIVRVQDLLFHFPTRYEDFSKIIPVADLGEHESATVSGTVSAVSTRRTWRRGLVVVEATIHDPSGSVKAVWFNQPFIAKTLRTGATVNLAGKIQRDEDGVPYLSNPSYETVHPGRPARHTAGLIPIYPETKGLTSRGIRYLVRPILAVLPKAPDFIPEAIRKGSGIIELNDAFRSIHFPTTLESADAARRRFAFEDLFLLQLVSLSLKRALSEERALSIEPDTDALKQIFGSLPFPLTASQERSFREIASDLSKGTPMNRLLQGDVGSGKTVVAAIAGILAAKAGYAAVFMAPTEILARQHHRTFEKLFGAYLADNSISLGLLLGSTNKRERREILARFHSGEPTILIGTHALLENSVHAPSLALVVIDEQHRFGVRERAQLADRAPGRTLLPHFLSMSATPIPRTLALAVFGDLELSTIDELPNGRKPIETRIIEPRDRTKAYDFVRKEVQVGRQAFVICPRITSVNTGESEQASLKERVTAEVRTVTAEFEKLSKTIFPDLRIGMLHGKLKVKEKEAAMQSFVRGDTDILVATSVIEVGVDVPNASVMVIEGAEYFGLAQLYQFRGRIGRGEHPSTCLLFTESESEATRERLAAIMKARNGFELAEFDLELRGPGQFLGSAQTGLPDVAMQSLRDPDLIRAAREAAKQMLALDPDFSKHPALAKRIKSFEATLHLE